MSNHRAARCHIPVGQRLQDIQAQALVLLFQEICQHSDDLRVAELAAPKEVLHSCSALLHTAVNQPVEGDGESTFCSVRYQCLQCQCSLLPHPRLLVLHHAHCGCHGLVMAWLGETSQACQGMYSHIHPLVFRQLCQLGQDIRAFDWGLTQQYHDSPANPDISVNKMLQEGVCDVLFHLCPTFRHLLCKQAQRQEPQLRLCIRKAPLNVSHRLLIAGMHHGCICV
mmetsp:Transcript_76/g.208  ORF Transcript_76/g.208 Transcript_76/m.208 type:complete len:225 (+) Transcript_76:1007-1681(+)